MITESKGYTLGISNLIDDIADIINDLLQNICIGSDLSWDKEEIIYNFSYPNLRKKVKIDNTDEGYDIYKLKFTIDSTRNLTSWLSNDTDIELNILVYPEFKNKSLNVYNNSGIGTTYDIENNKSIGHIVINFELFKDKKMSINCGYKIVLGNYQINLRNNIVLKSLLQHEFNHIHKTNFFKETDERDIAYEALLRYVGARSNDICTIFANGIYKYCLGDERNAHLEQFCKEYDKKTLSSSDVWISTIEDNEKFYKQFANISEKDKNKLYRHLYWICEVVLPTVTIKETPISFCNKLKNDIMFNIEKFLNLLERAADMMKNINENYNQLFYKINRKINVTRYITEEEQIERDTRFIR